MNKLLEKMCNFIDFKTDERMEEEVGKIRFENIKYKRVKNKKIYLELKKEVEALCDTTDKEKIDIDIMNKISDSRIVVVY